MVLSVTFAAPTVLAQGGKEPELSPDEQKMAQAVNTAADPAAKVKAATAFVKKYPKSSIRWRMANLVAYQVSTVTDPAQKASLAQEFKSSFTEPAEQEAIMPVLLKGLADSHKPDEAFAAGTEFLNKNPDSLQTLVVIVGIGADQARARNSKFADQSLQYAAHAIQLIESDKRPAGLEDAAWAQYKTVILPNLYQLSGLINLVKGDAAQAKVNYTKASQLAPADAFNWVMLAGIVNDEYQKQASHYQSLPSGPGKDEELKKAQALMDSVIDTYAHAVALSEGKPALQTVRQQYLQDLETYYKYRHQSTEGMQQLIDKYKAKP